MTYLNNVHTSAATAHDRGDVYTESGMRVPVAEVRARAIAEQAGRWLAFAAERTRMQPRTITAKALASVAFSVHHGASGLAVPSKLAGTSEHQRALWALVSDPAEPWAALEVEAAGGGLVASHDGRALGHVQSKHLGWVRPLLPFGLTVHLGKVTGSDYEAYTLGCNVVFGHVGPSLDRLLAALGTSGDSGGDGAPAGPMPSVRSRLSRMAQSVPPPGRPNLHAVRLAIYEASPPPDAATDPAGWLDHELRTTTVLMHRGMRYTGGDDYVLDLPFENALTDLQRWRFRLIGLAAARPSSDGGGLDAFLASASQT